MKTYEKPTLTLLIVSANDALCACDTKTRGNPFFEDLDRDSQFGNDDGLFDGSDPAFASTDPCDYVVDYLGYCKFTGTNQLFTS